MVPHTKKGDERHGNSLILGTGAPPPNSNEYPEWKHVDVRLNSDSLSLMF